MTFLAILLDLPEPRETLVEGHHFLYAGFVLLILGTLKALLGRRQAALPARGYHLGLLLGSGVCLVALGLVIGENTGPYLCELGRQDAARGGRFQRHRSS